MPVNFAEGTVTVPVTGGKGKPCGKGNTYAKCLPHKPPPHNCNKKTGCSVPTTAP